MSFWNEINAKWFSYIGIKFTGKDKKTCIISCLEGKQARRPFKSINYKRATTKLGLVHSDVCGPMSVKSIDGKKYLLIFVDDYSRKIIGYFLETKTEVLAKFIEHKAFVENQTGYKIKALRSDNGTKYINKNFQKYLVQHGIKHETTVPYSPQQNGLAERTNRSIIEKTKCLL